MENTVNYELIKSYLGDNYKRSDDEIINLYLQTFEFYQRLREELKPAPLLFEYTNKGGATNLVKNPLAIELTKVVQTLNNLLKSLGLTPAQCKAFETGRLFDGEDDV